LTRNSESYGIRAVETAGTLAGSELYMNQRVPDE
jgi:hypothetical protein